MLHFFVLTACLFFGAANAAPFLISVGNPSPSVTLNTAGQSAFFPNAGILNDGTATPISLRATVVSMSAGDSINIFRSGDNPVVRANTAGTEAQIRWEVTNANTGAPIFGDPAFLISDIDGAGNNRIESVSAQCAGLTSYTTNGVYIEGVNANTSGAADTNIRITETNGTILGEGTQNQGVGQQEAYLQYNWTNVSEWVVTYFATSGGRWYVHDADGDIPFDGTRVLVDLVDLATIKTPVFAFDNALQATRPPRQGEDITWTIDLSNDGPADATGANITDNLPANVTLVSANATSGNIVLSNGNSVIDWSGVDIPVGGVQTLTIVATVNGPPGEEVLNETNTAQADQSKCSSRDRLESTFIVDTPEPSLEIIKSVGAVTTAAGSSSSLTDGGDTISYSYLVENSGNVTISNVTPVDAGPRFGNNMAPQGALSAYTPASANLDPGDTQVFTATYTLAQADVDNVADGPNPATGVVNTATATGMPAEGTLAAVIPSMATTGFVVDPAATITKTVTNAGAFSQAGDTINYSVTITNTGNIELTSVRPQDAGPDINGMGRSGTFNSFTPASATLAPGQSQVFTATYVLSQNDVNNVAGAANQTTAIDNTATLEAQSRQGQPPFADAMVETGFAAAPLLTIVKSVANPGAFDSAGDTISYQWEVENTGNVTVNNVVVSDPGPTFDGQPGTNTLQALSPSNANLAPNQTETFTATYTLSQADVDRISAVLPAADRLTAIDNSSVLTGVPAGGTLAPINSNIVETGFAVSATLELEKTVTPATTGNGSNPSLVDAGDSIAYQFRVSNTGTLTIDNIAVNDSGPTFGGNPATGTFTLSACSPTSLAPNQEATCSATYVLSQTDVDNAIAGGADSIDNSATATGQDPNNTSVVSPPDAAETSITATSLIELQKTAGAPTVTGGSNAAITDPGDTVTYQLLVTNQGNNTLDAVTVSDSIASVSCPALSSNGQPFTNGTSSLAPSDSVNCTATYSITQPNINAGQVTNTASVTSTDQLNATIDDNDMVVTPFTQRTSIVLTKAGPSAPNLPTAAGQVITYDFTLQNTGNVSLTAPTITDPQCETPAGTLNRTQGYISGDAGIANELDANETWVFQCTYMTDAADFSGDGRIVNTASGTGTPPAGLTPPMGTASAEVQAELSTGIAITKTAMAPTTNGGVLGSVVDEGDTINYSFEITNTGNVELSNVTLVDPLITDPPNSANFVSCPITTLAAQATVICTGSYSITQADLDAGMIDNTATVSGTPNAVGVPDPTAMSSAMVSLPPSPVLTVVKTAPTIPSGVSAGTSITYSYLVTNDGNVAINTVLPVDAGPTFNGNAAENSLSAFAVANPASLPISLAPTESQVFTADYVLTQGDIDNMASAADPATAIDNTATASGTPVIGNLQPVTPSVATTGVAPTPLIQLVKTSSVASAIAGQAVDYSFAMTNAGNVSLISPVINDAKCEPSTTLSKTQGYDSGDDNSNDILDVGETWLLSCSYTLMQTDIDAGSVVNTATATGQDPAGIDVSDVSGSAINNDDPTTTPLIQAPAWIISKATSSVPSMAGDTLAYQFSLDNTGNVSISAVAVNDPKCASTPQLIGGDLDGNLVLAPDEVWSYSCTSIPVTQPEIDAGQVNNTVTASGTPPQGMLPDTMATLMTPVNRVPSLSVVKTIGLGGSASVSAGANPTAVDGGDVIGYSFAVLNSGNVTIDSLNINDVGPSFNGSAGSGTLGAFNCPQTTVAPGQTVNCDVTYTLSQADVDNAIVGGVDAVSNMATAEGEDPLNAPVVSPPSDVQTTIANQAELSTSKVTTSIGMTGAMGETIVGDTISYAITTNNIGNATISGVTVSDDLAGVMVSCPSNTNENAIAFSNGTGTLPPGESVTCTASYTVTQTDLNTGRVLNTARGAGVDPNSNPVTSVADVDTPLSQNTSILLQKSATLPGVASPPAVGQNIDYTFTLDNTGNVSLSSPQVVDPNCGVASPLTFAAGYVSGDIVGPNNTAGVLDTNEVWTFTCSYTTDQDDFDAGGVTNTAVGSGTPPASSGLPAPTSTASNLADLQQETSISMIKSAGAPSVAGGDLPLVTDVGDTIEYQFEVTNTGNVTLTGLVVSDPLITDAPNSGSISCPVTMLAAGVTTICTATYTLTQADVDAGTVMNDAIVTGQPPATVPPTTPPEGTSSSVVGITPAPELEVTKTASAIATTVMAGDLITYTFVVENLGNVTMDNVSPIDTGPTFDGLAASNTLSAFTPASAVLLPGSSQTFTATYELSQADLDNVAAADDKATGVNESLTAIQNTATADGEPANGVLPAVPGSMVETGVGTLPEITLIKSSVAPSPANAGSVINYTFELTNSGNVTISNPSIADAQCLTPVAPLLRSSGYVSGDTGVSGELEVGETWIFNCSYALEQADIDAGTVQNTAIASGTEPGGDPVSDTSDSSNPGDDSGNDQDPTNTPLVQTPSWTVAKSTTSVPSMAGDVLDYRFVLDNTGNVSISNVIIDDPKCAATPSLDSGDTDTNSILDPSEIWVYTCMSIPVTQAEIDLAMVDNSVTVTGTPPNGTIPPATNMISTPVAQTAAWSVEKTTMSVPTMAGDQLVYSFELTNDGNVSIASVSVSDAKCSAAPTLAAATLTSGDVDNDSRLDPNEVWTYSCTSIAVLQAEVDAGQVDNSVVVSGAPPIGTLANAEDQLSTPIAPDPSLALLKTAAAPTVGFGLLPAATDADDTIGYTFEVENDGNLTLDNLVINDLGITFNGVAADGTLSAINCATTVLAPAQTTSCSATYTLTQTDINNAVAGGPDSVSNSATATGEDPDDNDVTSPGSTATTTIVAMPDLTMVKTAGAPTIALGNPAITDPGDTITYSLVVTNSGNTALSTITVSDSIATVDCLPFVNGTDSLAVGASLTCSANYTIDQDDLNLGQVVNVATVDGTDPSNAVVSGTDSATVGFTQKASLQIVKAGGTPTTDQGVAGIVDAGDTVAYTFDVENTGNVTLDPVSVSDPLITAAPNNGTITCPFTALTAGQTMQCTATYTISAAEFADGEVNNTATADGTPPAGSGLAPPQSTSSATVIVPQTVGISLDKVAGLPTITGGALNAVVDEGDTITYTFNVENTGNVQLDSIVLSDPTIEDAPNSGSIACPFTTLLAGDSMSCTATYTITQDDLNSGDVNNTASATGTPFTTTPIAPPTADSSATVTLPPMPSMEIVKTASTIDASIMAGDSITYSYEITNTGNVTISAIEPIDAGPTFNGALATNSLQAFSPLTITLMPGDVQTITALYLIDQADLDNMAAAANPNTAIDNSATATGTPSNGVLATVPPSAVETGVAPRPELSLTKTSSAPNPATVGAVINYTFELQNTGNVSISNPTISDPQCQAPGSTLSFGAGYDSGDADQVGILDVGETWQYTCSYALDQADIDAGTVQNTAVATGQDPAGNDVSDTSDSGNPVDDTGGASDPTNTPLVQTPSWMVAKSTNSAPTAAGDTLIYNFVITNTGNVSIGSVAVADAKCAAAPMLNSGDVDNNMLLAPTEIWSYSCTSIGVSQTEVDLGMVDNSVDISGTPPSGIVPPQTSSISTPIVAAPSLTLTKSASAATTGFGVLTSATDADDTISYTFDVQNNGNVSVSNLQINDLGIMFNGMTGTGVLSAITCPAVALAPAQTTSCSATYTLSQVDIDNAIAGGIDAIENSATASGLDPSNSPVTSVTSTANTSIIAASSIEIVKTAMAPSTGGGADGSITDPGDTITYNLAIENTGNTTLSSITISDSLTTVDCTPFVNGTDSLAPGATINCSAEISLDQDDLNDGSVTNTASVEGTDPSGGVVDDNDSITTPVTQRTSIVLTKSASVLASVPPVVGEQVDYSFTLTNTGNVSLTNASVDDPKCGAILGIGSGYDSGDDNSNMILDANETWLLSCPYTISQADVNAGGVANTAVGSGVPPVGSGLPDPTSTANSLADIQQETGISLDKASAMPTIAAGSLNDVSDVGDTIVYTFTVENTGNVTLTNVAVTDPKITDAPNSGSIVCNDTTLVSQAAATPANPSSTTCTATYTLTQVDVDAGEVMNEAEVTADPPVTVPPSGTPSGTSSNTVPISPAPRLSVDKTASTIASGVMAGDIVTYSYSIENIGNVTIENVLPVDAGPTFNGVVASNTLGAFSVAGPASLPVDLAPGDTQVFTAEYVLAQDDIDNMAAAADSTVAIDNTATATGTPVNGNLEPVTPSTVETGVDASPELELIKSSLAPTPSPMAGAVIRYDFSLENTGNVTITNPVIDDALCQAPGATLSLGSGYLSGDLGQPGKLDVDEIWLFSCEYTIEQADIDAGTVQNTATATGQDPRGEDVMDVSDSSNPADVPGVGGSDPSNTPLQRSPSWMVEKATNSTPMQAGDVLQYTFTVSNTGNVNISSLIVSDNKCAAAPMLNSGDLNVDSILNPLEVWSYSCTSIVVTQDEANMGMVDNDVSVSGTPPAGTVLPPAIDDLSTPLPSDPLLSVVKSAATPTVGFGVLNSATDADDTIEYSFLVTNDGNVTIDTLSVVDDGVMFNGMAGTGSMSAIVCPITTLTPNQSTTCIGTYTLSVEDVDNAVEGGADSVTNIARATGEAPDDTVIDSPNDMASTTIVSMPALDIQKTAAAPTVNNPNSADLTIADPGDTITYTLVIQNTGNVTVSEVQVDDSIAPVVCPGFAIGVDSLAPGASLTCTAEYELQQSDFNTGEIDNTATVEGLDPFNTVVMAMDMITSGLTQKTSILLQKTVDSTGLSDPAQDGDTLTYTFELRNTGNVSLTAPQVEDPKCTNTPLTFGNGYVSGDNGNAVLDAGEQWVFSCLFTLDQAFVDNLATNGNVIDNLATGSGSTPAGSNLQDPSSTSGTLVDDVNVSSSISLDKTASLPTVALGDIVDVTDASTATPDTVTYSFVIENTGTVTLSDIELRDPLITGSATAVLSCGATTLAPTEQATCSHTYDITQTDLDAGSITNNATVGATPPPNVPPPSGSSGATVALPPAPELEVMKDVQTPLSAPVTVGSTITYSVLVTNTGNVTIDQVTPIDAGPSFNGVAGTNSLSAFTPVAATAPISLMPTESQLFTADYALSQIDIDNIAAATNSLTAVSNTATADGVPVIGNLPPVVGDPATTGVETNPSIELTKSSTGPAVVAAGALIEYQFSLLNNGNVTISSPIIDDPLCQIPGSTLSFASGYDSGDAGIAQSLDVGETWQFSCSYAITQVDIDSGSRSNTATASGQEPGGETVDDVSDSTNPGDPDLGDDDPSLTPLAPMPAWQVIKSTSSMPVNAGDTLVYQFDITNTGNVSISNPATGMMVNDPKCATTPALLASSDLNSDNIISPAGLNGVPAAETWVYTCTSVGVSQTEVDAGQTINTVSISGTASNGTLIDVGDMETTPIQRTPLMSLVKQTAGASVLNGDGSFDQAFNFRLRNLGNVTLSGAQIVDDVSAQFGACFDSVVNGGTVSLNDIAPANDSAVPAAGTAPVVATIATLAVGDSLLVDGFTARFDPNAAGCTFPDPAENSATSTASSPVGDITDGSESATPPNDGTPNDVGSPTPFDPPEPMPELGIAKSATILAFNFDFTFDVEYTILMQNTGDLDLSELELYDDLVTQFGAAFTASSGSDTTLGIIATPVVSVVTDAAPSNLILPTIDPLYQGDAANIFTTDASNLGIGDVIQVQFSVKIDPTALATLPPSFDNIANGAAKAPGDIDVEDQSNDGTDPTDGAGGDSSPTVVTLDDVADLPIELGHVSSQLISQNSVLLEWKTHTEVANLGFYVYARVNDEWQKLNAQMIPGQGDSVQIVAYEQVFTTSAQYFAISDVDGRGQETLHGPYQLGESYGVEAQRQVTDWTQANDAHLSKQQLRDEKRRQQMLLRNQQRRARQNSIEVGEVN